MLQQPLKDHLRQVLRGVPPGEAREAGGRGAAHLAGGVQQRAGGGAEHAARDGAAARHGARPLGADGDPEVAHADAGVGANASVQGVPRPRSQLLGVLRGDERHQLPDELHRLAVARVADAGGLQLLALLLRSRVDMELVVLQRGVLHARQRDQQRRDQVLHVRRHQVRAVGRLDHLPHHVEAQGLGVLVQVAELQEQRHDGLHGLLSVLLGPQLRVDDAEREVPEHPD
mmetsp:Transcript_99906/g.308241  ORF Transcript_99906/g.308241 Transcript_99906/m.308241 type:complete len:229 (-) Transcript_99906:3274-3960(-)